MAPESSRLKYATGVARKLDRKMGGGNFNTSLSKQWSESSQKSKHCNFFKREGEFYSGAFKVLEEYEVNFCVPWANIFDTRYVLSVPPEAGGLVHKTNELLISRSIKERKIMNI